MGAYTMSRVGIQNQTYLHICCTAKSTTFDFGRLMKIVIAMFADDQQLCFDIICPAVTNVTT